MNSRKIYLDTLEMCNDHSRAPHDLWTLPWAEKRYPGEIAEIRSAFPPDSTGAPGFNTQSGIGAGDAYVPGTSVDDWGCEFTSIQEGIIGEVKHPQIASEDWAEYENVHIPREWLSIDKEKINAFCRANSDRLITCGCCPRPFEQLQFIRGTVNLYMDLMDMPENMEKFLGKMHAFYCELLEAWAETDVDVLNYMDDWGSQQSLLIPPTVWRRVFKPMYKDYIDIAHRHGKKIFMHSDGYTLEIIPDLIELGLDALNTQIFCMGAEKLRPFRGKITFWGEIDRQHLLPYGSEEDIVKAVSGVYENLWENGGCVAQCEFGPGGNPRNVRKVFETWDRLTAK